MSLQPQEVPPVPLEDHPAPGIDERTRSDHEAQEEVEIQIEELSRRYEAPIRRVTMRFGSWSLWPPPWKDSHPSPMMGQQERAIDENRLLQGSRQGGLAHSVRTGEEQHASTPRAIMPRSKGRAWFHALRGASTDHPSRSQPMRIEKLPPRVVPALLQRMLEPRAVPCRQPSDPSGQDGGMSQSVPSRPGLQHEHGAPRPPPSCHSAGDVASRPRRPPE